MSEPLDFPTGDTVPGGEEVHHVEENPAPPVATQEAPSFNPAWEPLLNQLPTEFHNLIKPELSKWDQNYQSLNEKYNKYKDFESVDARDLAAAHTLLNQIQTPEGARQVYEGLGEVLGISAKEAEKLVEQQQVTPEEDPEELTPEQREIRELRQQLSKVVETQTAQETVAQQRAQAELQRKYEDNYTKAFEDIYTKDPALKTDTVRRDDLHARAMRYVQDPNFQGDEVQQAWEDQRKYNEYLAGVLSSRQDPNNNAPLHISPSGGNPGSGLDPAKMTPEQRAEAFRLRLEAAQHT